MLKVYLSFFFSILLFASVSAQNWRPFHENDSLKQYVYEGNFNIPIIGSNDTHRPIQSIVEDTSFLANGITIKTIKKGYSLAEVYQNSNTSKIKGRLFGDSIFIAQDSTLIKSKYADGLTLVFPHHYKAGNSWRLGLNNSIQIFAVVDSLELKQSEFYAADSTAIISLTVRDLNGNPLNNHPFNATIEASKSFGITKTIDFTAASNRHYYNLFNWTGATLSEADTRDFQKGDFIETFERDESCCKSRTLDSTLSYYQVDTQYFSANQKIIQYNITEWKRSIFFNAGVDNVTIDTSTVRDSLNLNKVYMYKYSGVIIDSSAVASTNFSASTPEHYLSPQFFYSNQFLRDTIIEFFSNRIIIHSDSVNYLPASIPYNFIDRINIIGSFNERNLDRSDPTLQITESESLRITQFKKNQDYYTNSPFSCGSFNITRIVDTLSLQSTSSNHPLQNLPLTYEWLDCTNNYLPISSDSNRFVLTNQSVALQTNSTQYCFADTSKCYTKCFRDTLIVRNNLSLAATINNMNYQWLDADSNFSPIPGETAQQFSPQRIGRYAVRIYSSECSAISRALEVIDTSCFSGRTLIMTDTNQLFATVKNSTYKWLDCEQSFSEIPGLDNKQAIDPILGKTYAVQIDSALCRDTSICISTEDVCSSFKTTIANQSDTFIVSNFNPNYNYQWLLCSFNYFRIFDAKDSIYINHRTSGSIGVETTNGFCKDTSECISIVGLNVYNHPTQIQAYFPNPAKKTLFLNPQFEFQRVSILDHKGALIFELSESKEQLDISKLAKGVYFIQMVTFSGKQYHQKFIKQ